MAVGRGSEKGMKCERETGNNENAERVNGKEDEQDFTVAFHLHQGWRKCLATRCVILTRTEEPDMPSTGTNKSTHSHTHLYV